MSDEMKYLFGPVPSRRLGFSLGVDIIPFKVCSLDCIYCQLGRTTEKTTQRKEYVPVAAVIEELKDWVQKGGKADYITLSGSGEPTLNSRFGDIIDEIKKITDIPVAVITNSTLLTDEAVRNACLKADLVVPSLDAADQEIFEKINRPASDINIEEITEALRLFRQQFKGKFWLEIFFIESVNTSDEHIAQLKKAVDIIKPDKIQLNTAVRPTAEKGINPMTYETLKAIADKLGDNAEVVASFSPSERGEHTQNRTDAVLSILKRRPCSLQDNCQSLAIHPNEALKYIGHFQQSKQISSEEKNGVIFYKVN
ncbi:MAG: radical SAM protein [Planctomycetes bacterium]|nr:radical SAM protein [Planctomycetota bacterium]